MRKSVLLVMLMLTGYCVLAQSDFVVTLKSDTVKGDVRILSYDQVDRVQIANKGRKELFSALDVLIVRIGGESYKSVKIDNSIRLMKILKSGYLSLYGFKLPNQSGYDGRYLVKLDGTSMEMPNLGFKKVMSGFLEECNGVSEKIKNGELGKSKIEEIIDLFNECVSQAKPVLVVAAEPLTTETSDKTMLKEAIQTLMSKIQEQDFSTREDALDILRDIQSKVNRDENVSNYLVDGLRSTLKDQAALADDLDKLISLFKK